VRNEPAFVSVVMPVYNCASTVEKAVESILHQSYGDFEFVIIDDGSTDVTSEMLAQIHDSRVRLVRLEQNSGIVNALQVGIDRSTGDFIARMDADDISLPDRLVTERSYLLAKPTRGLVGTRFALRAADGVAPGGRALEHAEVRLQLHFGNVMAHSSVMFTRALYERAGGYRQETWPAEDFDLWLRMSAIAEVGVLAKPLVVYRVNSEGISRAHAELQLRKAEEVARNALSELLSRDVDQTLLSLCIRYRAPAECAEMTAYQGVVLDAYGAVQRECSARRISVRGLATAAARRLQLVRYQDANGVRCWQSLLRLPIRQPRIAAALVAERLKLIWQRRVRHTYART
jgi:glycosyltransferase involved in cell wall biosynthesis